MSGLCSRLCLGALLLSLVSVVYGYDIDNFWADAENIVMDEIFSPVDIWSAPAQRQMSTWNEIDSVDNNHPFQVYDIPQLGFGAGDGRNTIGFLHGVDLSREYGLSYTSALAHTVVWIDASTGRINACDVMLNPSLPWQLGPSNPYWFESTVLHELGHCRGLNDYDGALSIMNSAGSAYLRGDALYMDDRTAIRRSASTILERDMVMYNKWHDGSSAQWMSMGPTTLREGDIINFNNITVENRGSQPLNSTLRFGIYLSADDTISTDDVRLNTGSYNGFNTYASSTFNWSAEIPTTFSDCSTRYVGGVVDDNNAWVERYEDNNAVTFTNGVPYTGSSFTPTALSILLAEDRFEPNDSRFNASVIGLPFSASGLSIDEDSENDYFRISSPSGGTLTVSLSFNHAQGNIDLQLLSSTGAVLTTASSTSSNESLSYAIDGASTYYIRAYGSGSGSCNQYNLSAGLAPLASDLIVTDLSVDTTVLSPGKTFRASAAVVNVGDGISEDSMLRYRLSTNRYISVSDPVLDTDYVSSLSAGSSLSKNALLTVPTDTVPDSYWVGACIDVVPNEPDILNNCSEGLKVLVRVPVPPIFAEGFE